MKLHLCCGDIYLKGYINIDIAGRLVIPGMTPNHATVLENYYQDHQIGNKKETRTDWNMDLTLFPWTFESDTVDEIVMIQGIEHFYPRDAVLIIREIHRILKPGGMFLVDFPDIESTVLEYIQRDANLCMRLIYCSHKNEYSVHHWGYTTKTFLELLGGGLNPSEKWSVEFRSIVQHEYPAVGCIAIKKE